MRWQRLRRQPSPEAVAVAGDRGESCNALRRHEVVDLGALHVGRTWIAAAEAGIALLPRNGESGREILRIGAHVERRGSVRPDLPGGARGLKLAQEPLLLRGAEHG